LRTHALIDPLGLGETTPELAWKLRSVPGGVFSVAWEIEAASTLELLLANGADLWRSGKVEEVRTNRAVYEGIPLGSRSVCWWRVRVWDDAGNVSAWSKPAVFELGLLELRDWSAAWIGGEILGGPRSCPPARYFRKTFSASDDLVKARLYYTALGLVDCEINGRPVTERVLVPGWTDFRKRVRVLTEDVGDLLKAGTNTIGCILGDGWYAGHVAHLDRQFYGENPCFLAQLELTYADGKVERWVTDSSWKTALGPIVSNDLLMGEAYDARRELTGWSEADFDDSDWRKVKLISPSRLHLEPVAGPFVKRQETFSLGERPAPLRRNYISWKGCTDLYDFGQNLSGRIKLQVRGRPGLTLRIRHAEMLEGEGLHTANLRSARSTDYYTLKGGEIEAFEPRFTFHGFRYVEIFWPGSPEDLVIERLEGVVLHSEMPATGHFECSDPLLNRLHQNIVWGQKSNFLEVPTDCPQRDERLGWTGDAQVFIQTATFNFDVRGFMGKWLQDLQDAQFPNGEVPMVAPRFDDTPQDGGPAWSDAIIICPWTLWRCFGENRFIEQNYSAMRRYLHHLVDSSRDWIRAHPESGGFTGFGDWLALDGGTQAEGKTLRCLIGTAFLAYDCALMAEMAGCLGEGDDQRLFESWQAKATAAFNRRFVTGDGMLVSHTQTAYVLALRFNLLPTSVRPLAARNLVNLIRENENHLATGFVGTPYLCEVLEESGYLDVAYALLQQETFPSWLFSVKNGATTIWERWDGWTPEKGFQTAEMNSFNHYAYGAIGAWMYRSVAGLGMDSSEGGYRRLIFRPRPGGTLTWASARLETSLGLASIRWEKRGEDLDLDFEVPVNAQAVVHLPPPFGPVETVFESGRHHLRLPLQRVNSCRETDTETNLFESSTH
jgi:alpha-L-rhamnosidase